MNGGGRPRGRKDKTAGVKTPAVLHLFEREKREGGCSTKVCLLLPDEHMIAKPEKGMMDKMRMFYEGTVNVWRFPHGHVPGKNEIPSGWATGGNSLEREKREGGC